MCPSESNFTVELNLLYGFFDLNLRCLQQNREGRKGERKGEREGGRGDEGVRRC